MTNLSFSHFNKLFNDLVREQEERGAYLKRLSPHVCLMLKGDTHSTIRELSSDELKAIEYCVIDISDAWDENTMLINASGIELLRVQQEGEEYLVQTFSSTNREWITQKAYTVLKDAMDDCAAWYE